MLRVSPSTFKEYALRIKERSSLHFYHQDVGIWTSNRDIDADFHKCTQVTTIRVDLDEQGRRRTRTEVVRRDCGLSSCPQSANYVPSRS